MVNHGTIASKSMTIKNSGTSLSFSEIESEFGTNPTRSLGSYRVSQNFGALTNQPLDAGIPSSGEISFNDFYGKQLNVIVDFYSGGSESRQVAKSRYNNGNVNVVGGFKSKPSNTSGTHVKIHVNKTISSVNDGNQGVCALRTGNWSSGTTLSVDVGSSGKIAGAGGNGGRGANNEGENGVSGQNGNSGLGVEYTCIVNNSGTLVGGGGGGSGGGGGYDTDKNDDELGSGGGGGGGAGIPFGEGGDGGDSWDADGSPGNDGTETEGGAGGSGGNADDEGIGGRGGNGGPLGGIGFTGRTGSGDNGVSSGGQPGAGGFGIRRLNSAGVTLNGNSATINVGSVS